MTASDYDEDSIGSSNRTSSSNDDSLLISNSKHYQIVEITVDNYSWNIIDLFDNKK